MTEKQFYDWQTVGGTDDVMRFVNALESADISWCTIGGFAVNHWAEEPMVTKDLDFVVAVDSIDRTEQVLIAAGFKSEKFEWSVNFRGHSKVSIQLTTEDFYRDFASRGVAADVHGILLRVATLEDTLAGKMKAWGEPTRRQSKQAKDFTDIVRLVEAHPELWDRLTDVLKAQVRKP
ncbi:MAG TPA: nucleotidyl transferase AbiEii/AbiGii toxin family protein [Pyrinomonadaceae bacterium]|nr:nucleotidyl transferase AbiEii/AbiGii toxin family protein [Pyrinomonadaceae bacterium]